MVSFKEFLCELSKQDRREMVKSTFAQLTLEQALEIVAKDCKKSLAMFRDGRRIYRGMKTEQQYGLIKPSIIRRQSQNTYNLVNILMSYLPDWKGYPPRDRSAICTTNMRKASVYSNNGMPHIVLPLDGFSLGVCPDNDIFLSFSEIGRAISRPKHSVEMFNGLIVVALVAAGIIHPSDTDASKLMRAGKTEDEYFHDLTAVQRLFSDFDRRYANCGKKLDVVLSSVKIEGQQSAPALELVRRLFSEYRGNLMDLCSNILDPEANGFMLLKNSIPDVDDNEVWTDSDSIVIEATQENLNELLKL